MNQNNDIKKQVYSFNKAIDFLSENKNNKFIESVETSIHLILTPKKKNINVKGYSILPHGNNKIYKIAIFTTDLNKIKNIDKSVKIITDEDLNNISKKNIDFNLLITDHNSIIKMGKLSKILNAKKIMPDIKYGTITDNPLDMINRVKNNYIKFKTDKNNIIHCSIGKIDLTSQQLKENIETLINDIKKQKPKECKTMSIEKIYISSTMGTGISINIKSLNI